MKKYLQQILLFTVILASSWSQANFSIKMDIESKLEQRVQQMLGSLDPHAQVFVKTELKSIYSPLPGVALESTTIGSASSLDKIDFDDIKKIQISIITSLDEIPDWMKKEIEASLSFENIPIQITHKKFEDSFIEMVQKKSVMYQTSQIIKNDFISNFNSKTNLLMVVFLALGALVCITLFVAIAKLKTTIELQSKYIVNNLATAQQNNDVIDISTERASLPKVETHKLSNTQFKYEQINLDSVTALIADCYWCELDSYAHFIWSQLGPEQQKNILLKLDFLRDYSQHFIQFEAQDLEFAHHPYYLRPTAFEWISQKDLAEMLNQNLSLWHHLSPIRQQYLPISIQQKMKCLNAPAKAFESASLNKKSSLRTLNVIGNIQHLSAEDETYLLEHPEAIPQHLVAKVPTLIWFSKLDLQIRQSLLNKLSAEDIAYTLIGPESVLTSIYQALPEKKLKLVEQFHKQIQPSREAAAYQYLFTNSIKLMDKKDLQQSA